MNKPADLGQGTLDLFILKVVALERENNRRAKYYALTRAGRKELAKEAAQWERLSAAISVIVSRA
jgi:DNA-binding PadR family transcriptional regulator